MTSTTEAAASSASRFSLPSLGEQADLVERHKLDTLLYCPNPWALRHVLSSSTSRQRRRYGRVATAGIASSLYCGPRKVDQWRQLVKAAEPTLFITLTKAGQTVEEAARTLTVFMRYLRRGSKV
jgi:hypothetical protein